MHKITLNKLWVISFVGAILILMLKTSYINNFDFLWGLKNGEIMFKTKKLVTEELFSFPNINKFYINDQWLYQIISYLIYMIGGFNLINFIHAILVTFICLILFKLCYKLNNNLRLSILSVLIGFTLSVFNFGVRAQIIGVLFFSLYLYMLFFPLAYRQRYPRLYFVLFPIIMICWVNSHSSFVLGLILIGCFLISSILEELLKHKKFSILFKIKRIKILFIFFILSIISVFINPYGYKIITHLFNAVTSEYPKSFISEWAYTSVKEPLGIYFFVMLFFTLILVLKSKSKPEILEFILLLIFGAIGLIAIRFTLWFGIIIIPLLSSNFGIFLRKYFKIKIEDFREREYYKLNFILSFLILGLVILYLPWFREVNPLIKKEGNYPFDNSVPINAVEFLKKKNIKGRIFHTQCGGYLEWALYPDVETFLGIRVQEGIERIMRDYYKIIYAIEGWGKILDKYKINYILLNTMEQRYLISCLKKRHNWDIIYSDKRFVIFEKK